MAKSKSIPAKVTAAALDHLRSADARLSILIDAVGPFKLQLKHDRFEMLLGSIVSQQISTTVARTIFARLQKIASDANGEVSAPHVSGLTIEELRAVGLSRQKAAYVLDLATQVSDGRVQLDTIHKLDDQEIIRELTAIHGIGVWTAQMFLMFCLGRPDVFPFGDLGIRMAIRNIYELDDLPGKKQAEDIAAPWKPYASIASWYLWRSLDLPKSA